MQITTLYQFKSNRNNTFSSDNNWISQRPPPHANFIANPRLLPSSFFLLPSLLFLLPSSWLCACSYPNQGDCGVPRAFGSWRPDSFAQVMPAFREMHTPVLLADGETDVIGFDQIPAGNFGAYQFSFLPLHWLNDVDLNCSSSTSTPMPDEHP